MLDEKPSELVFAPRQNPFSTHHIDPSNSTFIGLTEVDLNDLADNFLANNLVGQITGPHGCGKTTLTHALEKQLELRALGRFKFQRKTILQTKRVRSDSPSTVSDESNSRSQRILVVDGAERLSLFDRHAMIRWCLRNETGLLLTAHQPIRKVPVLFRVVPEPATLIQLAESLQEKSNYKISQETIVKIYNQTAGNIREALFVCYDEWESHRCSNAWRDLA